MGLSIHDSKGTDDGTLVSDSESTPSFDDEGTTSGAPESIESKPDEVEDATFLDAVSFPFFALAALVVVAVDEILALYDPDLGPLAKPQA